MVVLLSDGICPEGEESPWLLQAMKEDLRGDLQRAANRILSLAAQKSGTKDDRSIMIVRIVKNEQTSEEKADEEELAAS